MSDCTIYISETSVIQGINLWLGFIAQTLFVLVLFAWFRKSGAYESLLETMSRYSVPTQETRAPRYLSSSRSTYPSFISIQDTLKLHLSWGWRGLVEGFRWDTVVQLVYNDPEIRSNVFKSLVLNSLSLTSIYIFDLLLHPLVRDQQKWFHRNIGWFYQILWLLPVLGVSFYLNSSWCTVIAKRTYALQHGSRAVQPSPVTYTGMLTALATSAYRIVMVLTSIIVSFALGSIPYIGPFAGFTFLCWVDAYYYFEFIWQARGMSLSRRVRHLEERWAYYFAFGLPSAALCTWGSGLANAALFALIFPAYIIMAIYARPVPADPYNPLPFTSNTNTSQVIHHLSPFIPIRLPIFALVIWLNDWIVRVLSVGGSGVRQSRGSGGRNRAFSDTAESIEQGEGIELNPIAVSWGAPLQRGKAHQHVNGLGRRKGD